MNDTFVRPLRRTYPALRGYGRGPFICSLVVFVAVLSAIFATQQRKQSFAAHSNLFASKHPAVTNRSAAQTLASLGWMFEPNLGQSPSRVKFLSRGSDASVFLTEDSAYISWERPTPSDSQRPSAKKDFLKLQFLGSARSAKLAGERLLPGKTNYLIGRDPSQWHTNIPHYAAARYAGLYPGVDAQFYGGAQGLEYDLTVARASDARRIAMHISGADSLQIDPHGDLLIYVKARQLTMRRPHVYQVEGGVRTSIRGDYRLLSANTIGFEIGRHRSDLPIVIDPSISIGYTTFLGGAGAEKGNSVAVDANGNIYVGGTTTDITSFTESTTCNDVSSTACSGSGPGGSSTLFVAKVDTSTTVPTLAYLTFIGGSGDDQGGIVAVDSSANLAILGWTTSTDFPATVGGVPAGPVNLTVSKLNTTGNAFIYSEYYGGSGAEATQGSGTIVTNSGGGGIATDSAGDVFVTSDTTSIDLPQPSTPNGFQQLFEGTGTASTPPSNDGFLAEFDPSGTLLYSTYFGIQATVGSAGVAVDSSDNAYVTGFTSSTSGFPASTVVFGPGGSNDAFVMKINPAVTGPTGLVFASLLGGSNSDQALSITTDAQTPPNAYISGITQSTDLIPSTGVANPPFQSVLKGNSDGFFAVIAQSGGVPSLQYITYLGGSGADAAQGVAMISPTQVFVAGETTSPDFPSLCSLQGFSGSQDAFIAVFNPSVGGASSLLYTSFLGGSASAQANSIGVDSAGDAIIFGDTLSSDYPLGQSPMTTAGFQAICTSCQLPTPLSDAFLTTVKSNVTGTVGCVAFNPSIIQFGSFADGTPSPALDLRLTNDGSGSLSITSITVTGANSGDFSETDNCVANSPIQPNGTCDLSITFLPQSTGVETAQLQVFDDGVGSPQTLTLTGTGTGTNVTLSGSSLSFPNTPQGQISQEQTISVTNTTGDPVSVQEQPIQGPNAADFIFGPTNSCLSIIAPGGTCIVSVEFAPNENNPPAGGELLSAQVLLSFVDSSTSATQNASVTLSGTEVPSLPGILFSPTSLAFSGENVGGTTGSQPITVTNNGSAPLAILSVGITGPNSGDFSETDTCVANSPIAPTHNCTISVVFQPHATGPLTANVSVTDNVSGSPQLVQLTGTGTAAGVVLTPSTLTFAGQNPGTPPSTPQPVTLQNTGNGPLTISSIAVTGANSGDFAQTNNCPVGPSATLSPGNACSIAVTFAPTGTGPRSASLSISDSALPSPQSVSLKGTGTIPGVQFNLLEVHFGTSVLVGSQSSLPLQVTNSGNGTLVITNVGFVGPNPADFQAGGSCVGAGGASISVAPGANCTVSVIFAPQAAGTRTAFVSLTDNAPGSPQQQIQVLGTSTDFQLAGIVNGSTSATVNAGESATFSLQVSSANGFSGTVAMVSSDPIPASTTTIAPMQVAVSGQATGFSVTVTTTSRTTTVVPPPFFSRPFNKHLLIIIDIWLLAFALAMLEKWKSRRCKCWFRPGYLLASVLLLTSCGGGSSAPVTQGTPAGTYTVIITGTNSGVQRTINLSITVQ